jgi:hypothetical protein
MVITCSCPTPPHCNTSSNFSISGGAIGWDSSGVKVVADAAGKGWNVTASNSVFTLERRVELVTSPWSGARYLAISDAISVHSNLPWPKDKPQAWGVAAIQIQHSAQFDSSVKAASAEVPGVLYPFDCSTLDNSGEYHKDGMSYGSFGNPTVYMQVGIEPSEQHTQ